MRPKGLKKDSYLKQLSTDALFIIKQVVRDEDTWDIRKQEAFHVWCERVIKDSVLPNKFYFVLFENETLALHGLEIAENANLIYER